MRYRFGIAFPVIPPVPNGIGDYTARLAATFGRSEPCIVFTHAGSYAAIPGVEIVPCATSFENAGGLVDRLHDNPVDILLVQYNPFSYGRWGLNLRFPETIRAVKREFPDIRVGLMVHEAFVPMDTVKQTVMTTWQRYQLLRLGGASDIIFFSISPWVERFGRWFPNKQVIHAPVGSNIPKRDLSLRAARAESGIEADAFVIAAFGSNHESRQWDWIVDAAESVFDEFPRTQFVYAGTAGELLATMVRRVPFRDFGRLPADELSAVLTSSDMFLSPFRNGISSRKGSAIVALQHGLATLSTSGEQTDRIFHDALLDLIPSGNKLEFINQAIRVAREPTYRTDLASRGYAMHEKHFDWPVVANVFRAAFENVGLIG